MVSASEFSTRLDSAHICFSWGEQDATLGFPLLRRDTVIIATLNEETFNGGWLTVSEVYSIIVMSGECGSTQAGVVLEEDPRATSGLTGSRRRVTGTWHEHLKAQSLPSVVHFTWATATSTSPHLLIAPLPVRLLGPF